MTKISTLGQKLWPTGRKHTHTHTHTTHTHTHTHTDTQTDRQTEKANMQDPFFFYFLKFFKNFLLVASMLAACSPTTAALAPLALDNKYTFI